MTWTFRISIMLQELLTLILWNKGQGDHLQVQEKYRIWVWDCTVKWCHPMNHWNYWCFLSFTSFLALAILCLGTAAKVLGCYRAPEARVSLCRAWQNGPGGERPVCIRLRHAREGAKHDCSMMNFKDWQRIGKIFYRKQWLWVDLRQDGILICFPLQENEY